MAIPDFQSLMLPALNALSDGAETSFFEVRQRIAEAEGLAPEDMRQLIPSGRQPVFDNRVGWAMYHLRRARLVENVRRGIWRLTEGGKTLLAKAPPRLDVATLRKYPAYAEWPNQSQNRGKTRSERDEPASEPSDEPSGTPEESLDHAVQQLRDVLEAEVLDRVREAKPEFLEQVIVDLLLAMGYGGGDPAMGRVTGRSGDGGIDGTIREDALGLDEVYVQAKRYADGSTVGEGALRNFAGAIDAAGTSKGVFVTTTRFTDGAKDYVDRSPKRIVLIDGKELARLMVAHDVGVRTRIRHVIKRIDEDYFRREGL